jgi:hypothetical protein
MASQIQSASKDVLLYCNTKDAMLNTDGDYVFTLARAIKNVKTIQLMSYNLIWSFPNFRTSTNKLIFSEADTPSVKRTVTFDVGNYEEEDVTSELAEAMSNAGSQVYTVSVNYVTEAFTITGGSKNFTIYLNGTTMNELIGLTADSTSVGNVLTLDGQMNLLPTSEIQIRLPSLIQNYEASLTNQNQDLIAVASLSGYAYGDVLKENLSSIECACLLPYIAQFTLSMVDESGFTPDFAPNKSMSFLFKIGIW